MSLDPSYEVIEAEKSDVARIFEHAEAAEHQRAYLAALFTFMYGFPVLETDAVESVDGFPKAGEKLVETLFERAVEFDRYYHSDVLSGGLMMNNGPSKSEDLEDWQIGVPPLLLEARKESVPASEARFVLLGHSERDRGQMEPVEWIDSREGATVKLRELVKDTASTAATIRTLAEMVKEPVFRDEFRHAGPKTTLQLAEMLREEGALLYIPPYLEDERADEAMA